MSKRLDDLSELVREIDARAHVNELFSAQLLLRVGLLYQDPHHFVAEVIENVGRDLAVAGSRVENAFGAQRARRAGVLGDISTQHPAGFRLAREAERELT